MTRSIKNISSKWKKTKALLKDSQLHGLVPSTKLLSKESLKSMLKQYGIVYVKPVSGTYGLGVMRLKSDINNGKVDYQLHSEKLKKNFTTFDSLYRGLLRRKRKRKYLVQQGIKLLKHNGRIFDIRVMVQRNTINEWVTTGIIARVASTGKIVTNYHSGGKPVALEKLLINKIGETKTKELIDVLSSIGKQAAISLSRSYPSIDSVGADIGIDTTYHPWIIELNTNPDPYIFRHLGDTRVYRRVLRFARALGRIKALAKRVS